MEDREDIECNFFTRPPSVEAKSDEEMAAKFSESVGLRQKNHKACE